MKSMINNKSIFLMMLFLSLAWSCKKDSLTAIGTVTYTGSVAADGCDWVIMIDSVYYHPENLADQYKVNNAKVNVSYHVLSSKFQCGTLPVSAAHPGMSIIHINRLAKAE